MEMHQVRYFLAVARELNFTRAAQQCNVAQPSLTRAIKLLEIELGGELFRRERSLSHLTDFGQRMLPLLQQCHDSAVSAKELAVSLRKGTVTLLSVALSTATDAVVIEPALSALTRAFAGLELRIERGTAADVLRQLKSGDAEVAIAGPLGETWDRLDSRPLFTEDFKLAVSRSHALATRASVVPDELGRERLLRRPYCEFDSEHREVLRAHKLELDAAHALSSEHDLLALVGAGLGVALVPQSAPRSERVVLVPVEGVPLKRTVYVHGVAGRRRSAPAAALVKLLRAADWSRHAQA